MQMKMSNGDLVTSEKENLKVFADRFTKAYISGRSRYNQAAKITKKREQSNKLDNNITWKEFTRAIRKIKQYKVPGTTEVPANVFKYHDGENLKHICVVDFWEEKADY